MVARINTGKNIRVTLHYNEHKVQQKQAEILGGCNLLMEAEQMNFQEKLATFQKLTSLNERVVTNTLHVSLNFDPSEKLDNEQLISIATDYMQGIGFGRQPYLVYRHFDTGHPHIHIVTTNIQKDGSRISMHNLGRNQSEVTRKSLEVKYGLLQAESKKQEQELLKLKPVNALRINPGKRATKAAISNILSVVIPQYKYSSLAELNAVLKLYNVMADRCGEDTEVFKHNGLLFRVIDEQGNKISVPIKSSLFYMKPTLKNLEIRFAENEQLKQVHAKRLKATIDFALTRKSAGGLRRLIDNLKKESISVVLRQNKEGINYGITYIDHNTKCIFNGSDLGKPYSIKMILERTVAKELKLAPALADEKKNFPQQEVALKESSAIPAQKQSITIPDIMTSNVAADNYIPYQLKKKRKRKLKQQLKS